MPPRYQLRCVFWTPPLVGLGDMFCEILSDLGTPLGCRLTTKWGLLCQFLRDHGSHPQDEAPHPQDEAAHPQDEAPHPHDEGQSVC